MHPPTRRCQSPTTHLPRLRRNIGGAITDVVLDKGFVALSASQIGVAGIASKFRPNWVLQQLHGHTCLCGFSGAWEHVRMGDWGERGVHCTLHVNEVHAPDACLA